MSLEEQMQDWEAYKNAALYSEKHPTLAVYDYTDLEKFNLVLMGDEHIGNSTYREEEHRGWVSWCLENKIPIILMGDELECATRDSIGAGVYEQQEIIDQQLTHFYQIYKPLAKAGLILGIHPGNHELRLWKSSGVNLTKIIARELKIPYLGIGKLHYFKVGKERYTLYTTHGAAGARLPHTKMKSCLDLANMIDADIYAMGHVHALQHHVREFYRPDFRKRTVELAHKHFILTGAFIGHWGSYGHVKNYEPMQTGCPRLKLRGDYKQIRVSLGARDEQPEYTKKPDKRRVA